MIGPRPHSPFLLLYPEDQREQIQEAYEKAVDDWNRALSHMMVMHGVGVILVVIGTAVAAIMGPQIIVDMILILSR